MEQKKADQLPVNRPTWKGLQKMRGVLVAWLGAPALSLVVRHDARRDAMSEQMNTYSWKYGQFSKCACNWQQTKCLTVGTIKCRIGCRYGGCVQWRLVTSHLQFLPACFMMLKLYWDWCSIANGIPTLYSGISASSIGKVFGILVGFSCFYLVSPGKFRDSASN
jgi:hypothetical protein